MGCLIVLAQARTHEVECGSGGGTPARHRSRSRWRYALGPGGLSGSRSNVERKLTLKSTPGATLEVPDYPWTALPHSTLHPVVLSVRSKLRIEGLSVEVRHRAGDPWASGLTWILLLNSRATLLRNRTVRVRHTKHRSDWEVSALRVLISKNRIKGAGVMIQNQNGIQIGGLQDSGTAPIHARIEENAFEGIFSFSGIWPSSGIFLTPLVLQDRTLARPYTLQNGDTGVRTQGNGIRLRGNRLSNL